MGFGQFFRVNRPNNAWRSCCLIAVLGAASCGSPPQEEREGEDGIGVGSAADTVDPNDFSLPPSDATTRAEIMSHYAHLDPGGEVPRGLLEDAVEFMDVNKANIPVQTFLTVVDFSKFSGEDRFFLVNMQTGEVEPHKVAHGSGSDPDYTGWATLFSNVSGSLKTSLGFYLTGEIYDGTHVHSMRLDGLSPDGSPNGMANTNARSRAIVVHEADYVSESNTGKQGRSSGCLALDPSIEVGVVDRIHDGSVIYAATKPLNAPIGTTQPSTDAGTDSGEGAPDAAHDADSGSKPGSDSAASGDSDSQESGAGDDGGTPAGPGASWNNSSSSGGCAVASGRWSGSQLGFGLTLIAIAALQVRARRRDRSQRQ
jgi:hypothetical protein